MAFSSMYFVFVFLPAAVILCGVVPKKAGNVVLVIFSLLFYAWGQPSGIFYLLFSVIFNYLSGLELDYLAGKEDRKALLIATAASAAGNLIPLALFKYVVHTMPLGLSFYTFSALSYLFDVQKGRAEGEKNFLRFLLYISFFAKVTSGPIVQYAEMKKSLSERTVRKKDLTEGTKLFIIGLAKKVLLADTLGAAFAAVSAGETLTVLGSWLMMILYSFELYYDFSGYSDMAIGIARMFGFHFEKNFDHPYLSLTIGEFWRRWHISLGNWFKQYVYFPMGGSRVAGRRIAINLLTVWILTGIWHGSTLNFLVWGLYHGAFVMLERFVFQKRFDGIPSVVRILVTDLAAFVGWIFFFSPGLGDAFRVIGGLMGIGTGAFADNTAVFTLLGYLPVLAAAAIGATELPARMFRTVCYENRFHLREGVVNALGTAVFTLIAVSSTAGMLSSTYSTFLYFRF